jgi:zinc D-Ala-D-Ala carboxypeptidase
MAIRRLCVAAGLAMTLALVTGAVATADTTAGAKVTSAPSGKIVRPTPSKTTVRRAPARVKRPPPVVDEETLTPQQLTSQVEAAEVLRAQLMRSGAEVAAASSRLERLSAQANTLLGNLAVARAAQSSAQADATLQQARLVALGVQAQSAHKALGQLASDAYIRGGGPLGDIAVMMGALTSPSPDRNTDSLATVQYLVDAHARLVSRLRSLQSAQVTTSASAAAASIRATAAATSAAAAKTTLDTVIVDQGSALAGFQAAQAAQVARAAGVRGSLLHSEDPLARAADSRLARALQGQDFLLLMDQSSSCGKGSASYPNGQWPAEALCPLYAAPGESLPRTPAMAFNAMSNAYQRQSGSALCVTDGYRSYAEQVAVKLARPGLAATPGKSQHGLGLALDLCGGVQSFASPAHLWMKRNAPLYGWFHPAWAEPSGVLPEPWHWEFAN